MWHDQPKVPSKSLPEEERNICLTTTITTIQPIIPVDRYSKFTMLKRVTAWVFRFIMNVRSPASASLEKPSSLTVTELITAESYWISISRKESFPEELEQLKGGLPLPKGSRLLPLRLFIDESQSLLCIGGQLNRSQFCYDQVHPVILHGTHPVTRLIVEAEHLHLIHAGPTLLLSSLCRRFHIVGLQRTVRSVTRKCVTCKRHTIRPRDQLMGQLPPD